MADMTVDFLGKGLRFPMAVGEDGSLAASEGKDLIEESILIILGTAKGERMMRPDFGCGINELVFAPNTTASATRINMYVNEALLRWEPRIEVVGVRTAADPAEGTRLNIEIEYKVKSLNMKRNMVYPFYLDGGKK